MTHAFNFGQDIKRAFYLSPDMVAAGNLGTVTPPKRKKKKKSPFDEHRDTLDRAEKEYNDVEQQVNDIDKHTPKLPKQQPENPSAKSAAYVFGAAVQQEFNNAKQAGTLGDFANGLSTSWNNASRVFKGGTGAIAGGLGAVGAGLAAGGMQGVNAAGGLFGKQPFSNEAVNTAYGVADHYANAGGEYGKDFAQGLGLGEHGLAGTTMNNPSYGDQYVRNLQNDPAVSDDARRISDMALNTADFASKAAPAAALGGTAKILGNYATGAPLMSGVASTAPTAAAAPAATAATGTSRALQTASNLGSKLNSTGNPVGWSAAAIPNAMRAYENSRPVGAH